VENTQILIEFCRYYGEHSDSDRILSESECSPHSEHSDSDRIPSLLPQDHFMFNFFFCLFFSFQSILKCRVEVDMVSVDIYYFDTFKKNWDLPLIWDMFCRGLQSAVSLVFTLLRPFVQSDAVQYNNHASLQSSSCYGCV